MTGPRIGSLCSGYGGLDLGLMSVVGGSVAWHVEFDKHPSAVLEARFPGVPNYGDVKSTDWARVEPVDWLTAGYPCQPFSIAGKRLGEQDPRHLWPAVAEAIRALRPGNILLENVRGHLSKGFDTVLGSLADLGYDAGWCVVRASDAGAPHRRERVFILASTVDANGATCDERREPAPGQAEGWWPRADSGGPGGVDPVADPDDEGLQGPGQLHTAPREMQAPAHDQIFGDYAAAIARWEHHTRPVPAPTEPSGRDGAERLSPMFVEWMMGLPAGWVTDVLPRNPALKALGNGVVPQQAALAVELLTANVTVPQC